MSASLPARIHGGTDALGTARFDFSTNSNACGPCPAALAAVQAADASHYPDAGYAQLRQSLAAFHGVPAWRVVVAASASEFIFRITAWAQRVGASRVWIPAQAYGDYAHAAHAWGLQRTQVQTEADLVWACEPSSPLGQAHGAWPQWLSTGEAAASAQKPLQTLVLDLAYAPMRLSGQPALDATRRDRVWQLYSPNKVLALTGIRAAYAIAPVESRGVVEQLNALAASWPVGAHGEAMLLAWTSAAVQEWVAQTLPTLRHWKQTQVAMLQSMGWHCLPSDANFFCAKPPEQTDIAQLVMQLRALDIKLRDAASLGLPGYLRLSAQAPAAQQALQTGLSKWVQPAAAQLACAEASEELAAPVAPMNATWETSL